jgi:hypothetical protein
VARADWPARRAAICLALLAGAFLSVSASASARPAVTLKVKAIPIPGFPGTGDILGAGTEVESDVTIKGTEYGGFPSPMTGLRVYAPAGIKITTRGFATCAPAVLEATGPAGCPGRSRAGPAGVGLGVVSFGGEVVPEQVSIQEFFAPGGGLTFYVEGSTPASFQILEKSQWVMASPPFGPELDVEVPLVETVPGANDASVLSFKVKVGAAYRKGKRTVSYITSPKRCPRSGFPVKMEMKFLSGEIVTVSDVVPCPRR